MKNNVKRIELALLHLDYQTRAATDEDTAQEYAELPAGDFPPVTVYNIGGAFYLADGFHRVLAAKLRGEKHIRAEVREGTVEDAIIYGGTANNKQGKRPTREDTQHFMLMVWERRKAVFGDTPTGGNFAGKCGISYRTGCRFVQQQLAQMAAAPMPKAEVNGTPVQAPVRPSRLVGADGKLYPVRPVRPVQPTTEPVQPTSAPMRPTAPAAAAAPVAQAPQQPVYRDNHGVAHCVPLDRYGKEIPVERQGAFDDCNADKLAQLVQLISEARCIYKRETAAGNPAFAALRQEVRVQLDNAYNFASAAAPHCICRICQGQGCKACHERGWQTEEEYGRNPDEFKAEGVQA